MRHVPEAELVRADFILSILPPGEALPLAHRLAPLLAAAERKPVYADCNAVSPARATEIGVVIGATGAPYVDAAIIGGPPKPGSPGPVFYASGPAAPRLAALGEYGLRVTVLDGPVGAAAALKMSYAGITKGLTALGAAMMLGAERGGAAPALRRELAESQPHLLAYLTRQVPSMFPKAYRWVAEMEEIAAFLDGDAAAPQIYHAMAQLYAHLADRPAAEGELALLAEFYRAAAEKR